MKERFAPSQTGATVEEIAATLEDFSKEHHCSCPTITCDMLDDHLCQSFVDDEYTLMNDNKEVWAHKQKELIDSFLRFYVLQVQIKYRREHPPKKVLQNSLLR